MKVYGLLFLAAIASGCQIIGGINDRTEKAQGTPGATGGVDAGTMSGSGGAAGGTAMAAGGGSGAGGVTSAGGTTGGPDAQGCVLNSDCSNGLLCIFATCSIACRLDSDCSPGFRCLQTTTGAACVDSSTSTCNRTCPSGTACVDGVCRTPCTVRTPVEAGTVAPVEAGADSSVRGGSSEGGAVADASTGCRADQTCVNGGCVGNGSHDPGKDAGVVTPPDAGTQCVTGTKQCTALTPQTCGTDHKWKDGTACQYVCDQGKCTGVCSPGAKQCNLKVPEICGTNGQWVDGAPCPYECINNACTQCEPGAKQCVNNDAQLCDANGVWQTTNCQFTCTAGACASACTPGAKQCNGLTPQTCDPTGTTWVDGTACTYLCVASTGKCGGVCTPGSHRCSGSIPQTCNASGAWTSGTACQYLCDATAGVCTGVCTPGDTRCNGNTPQTCDATTAQWVGSTSCGSSAQCDAAYHVCKKFQGQTCGATNECVSGYCKDGYCCDSACTGSCQSCGLSGNLGTCSLVLNAKDDTCGGLTNLCSGSGQCKLADGQQCTVTSDCANNNCTTFYPDADQDGYGSNSTSQRLCTTSPPAGYVNNNSDCCDSDNRAYPGENVQNYDPYWGYVNGLFSTPNNCGSFDYDCNGNTQMSNPNNWPACNSTCSNYYCLDNPQCGTGNTEMQGYNGNCQAYQNNITELCK